MNRLNQVCLGLALGLLSITAFAAGNPELGKAKAMYCATCHGASGERKLPMWQGGESALNELSASKIVAALKAYRSGQRFHPMMQFFVMPMAEQDMEDIGAYYSGQVQSLYQRLGGKEAINAVVKDLLANGMADARLQPRMSRMDGARCERQLTDLLCETTGGPCKYVGRDMKTAHAGANVTETEWQAFAENLSKTFVRFNVPARERGELMQLIGPMKADIVGH
ncbi:MAG: c-type cytochrome [Hydrogenophilaceae bacterium]